MSKLASLLVKITANGAQAERELKELSKKTEDFGKKMKNVGASMTKYVTGPILALAAVSVKAANDQQQAEAKLLTALKGREDIQKRLIAQAGEMQSRTLFGDEEIISQQAFLAALGLSEQQINDTMEAAIQLSAALGMELDAAVKNLAKTYGGLSGELGESIPALKNLTAEQMKAGEAIKYVNENYKGFAETAADTGLGKLEQLKNKFMDLAAQIGEVLLPVLQRAAELLIPLLESFAQLSPEMQTAIVAIGGLAAAIGPALTALGSLSTTMSTLTVTVIPKLTAAFPALTASFSSFASTVSTVIGPLAAVAGYLTAVYDIFSDMVDGMNEVSDSNMEAKKSYHYKVYSDEGISLDQVRRALDEAKKEMDAAEKAYNEQKGKNTAGPNVKAEQLRISFAQAVGKYNGIVQAYNERLEATKESTTAIADSVVAVDNALEGIVTEEESQNSILGRLEKALADAIERQSRAKDLAELVAANEDIARLQQEIAKAKAMTSSTAMVSSYDYSPVALRDISFGVSGPQATDLLMGVNNINMETFRANALQKAEQIKGVIAEMNSIVSGAMSELAVTIGEGIGSMLAGEDFDWANRLLGAIGDMLKQLGVALIAYATSLEAFKKAFKNPWVALAAGIAAVAAGTAVKAIANKPIKLATGALAYGPTLAVVGDNPGATNDPEVVAPLSKLRNFMGGQKLELVGDVAFELHGDTMRALLDRNNLRLATLG